jgi:ABC-type lipoprotein release transport system permease subunit
VFLITGAAIGVIGDLVGFWSGCWCASTSVDPAVLILADQHRLFTPQDCFLSRLPADLVSAKPRSW